MTESLLVFVSAATLAVCIMEIEHSPFGSLIGRELPRFNPTSQPGLALCLVGITALVYIAAASYPALVLSGLRPTAIYKIWRHLGRRKHSLRRTLVILQFSLASFSILVASVAYNQHRYLSDKELGYDEKDLVDTNHL